MSFRALACVASVTVWASQAVAGPCGLDSDDCDGDGFDNAVDLCPFTASANNDVTTVTFEGTTTPLPTGAACTDPSALVAPTARLGHGVELRPGATVLSHAYVGDFAIVGGTDGPAVVARRAVLVDAPTPEQGVWFASGVLGSLANLGIDPSGGPGAGREGGVTVGDGLSASRSVSVGYGVHLGRSVTLGYGTTIAPNAYIDDNAMIGALVDVGYGTIVGSGVVVARGASLGAGSHIADGTVVGPNVQIGDGSLVGDPEGRGNPVRIRKGVTVGSCAVVEADATLGRDSTVGDHGTVGAGTRLSSRAAIAAGGEACSDGTTRSGDPCQGRYPRAENIDGDPSYTECPVIDTPTPDVDLIVSQVTVQSEVPAGFDATVSVTVDNTGIDRANAAWLALSWSTDGTWQEPEACRLEVGPIGGSQQRELNTSCAAPATPGSYQLVARIDATSRVPETDDSNNDRASVAMTVLDGAGACGSAHLASTASAPVAELCAYGSASSVSGDGPYTWTCTDSTTGSESACTSDRSCTSETLTWTDGGSQCDADLSAASHTTSRVGVDSDLPTSGNQAYVCDQGTWVADGAGECNTADDGVCGTADGTTALDAPSTGLCANGTASPISGSGPYTWTCAGAFGGADASCSSDRSCPTLTQSWQVGASACDATIPSIGHSQTTTATDSALPTSGSRGYTCDQGAWSGVGTGTCVTAVDAVCGASDGGSFASAPSSSLCAQGNASSVSGSGPYSWTCSGINGGQSTSCSANRSCTSTSQTWTVGGSTCSDSISTVSHGGSRTASDSGLPTTGSRTYSCSQGTWSGNGTGSCVTAVNGSCGSANGGSTTGTPSSGLCSSGSATSVSGSGPYAWSCVGSNGGSTASCSSNRSCSGISGSWTFGGSTCTASVATTSHGSSQTVSDTGQPTTGSRTFACNQGSFNQSGGSCVTRVNGSCGASNGGSFSSAPSSSLCSSGSASSVSGSGPYSWTCSGQNGGSTASCSANRSCGTQSQTWSVSGSTCSASVSAISHGGSRSASDTGQPTTGSRTYVCSQGSWSGSGTGSCVTRVNASCGSANGGSTTSAPSGSALCSAGSASGVSGSGPYSWTCSGLNGGSNASCSSNRSCSSTTGTWTIGGSTCSASVATTNHGGSRNVTDSGQPTTGTRTFSCSQGSFNQSGGSCVTRVNGSCGSAESGSSTSAPSSSLCSSGNASSVSIAGDGRWAWTCIGSNGGSTDTCRKNRSCVGTNVTWGSCDDNISTQAHGYSGRLTNDRSGYSGGADVTCSQGTWLTSNTSCRSAQVCTPGTTQYCGTCNCGIRTRTCLSDGSGYGACRDGRDCQPAGENCH